MDVPNMDWELVQTDDIVREHFGVSTVPGEPVPNADPMFIRSATIIQRPPPSTSPYRPIVEPVSPPSPISPCHIYPNQSKAQLMQALQKVAQETRQVEVRLQRLQEHMAKLEKEPKTEPVKEVEIEEFSKLTLGQRILAENMAKCEPPDSTFIPAPAGSEPIVYNPSEEFQQLSELFNDRLVLHVRRQTFLRQRHRHDTEEAYCKLNKRYCKIVKKTEDSARHKGKEAKYRAVFDHIFPEYKKLREDMEREQRMRARSFGSPESPTDPLESAEKLKRYANIPALLGPLDPERRRRYINTNGRIPDMIKDYEETNVPWTPKDCETFKELMVNYPKDFSFVASQFKNKSVADCIKHYYLTKKVENYKGLRKRYRRRPVTLRSEKQVSVNPKKKRMTKHAAETLAAAADAAASSSAKDH